MPKVKKTPLKERLWNKFSDCLLDLSECIPPVKKGPIRWLQEVRQEEPNFTSNACPSGVTLELKCIWLCEVIPIENFERQIPSIARLFQEHKTKRFFPSARSTKDLLATLRGFKETVLGSSWHNMGLLDCDKFKNSEIDYMTVEMESISAGHVAIYVRINLRKKFLAKINAIIRTDFPPYTVLSPPSSFRALIHGWLGWSSSSGETKKLQKLQSTLFDVKDSARMHLSKYFSGFLFRPGHILPSVELWVKEETSQEIGDPNRAPFKTFWDSVGFPKSGFETYVEQSTGNYSIILPNQDISDLPIKILCDKGKMQKESGHSSIDDQIAHHVNYWIPTLISLWSVRILYRDFIDEVSANRIKIFSKMKYLRARRGFKWARLFFLREAQFKRLRKDFDLNTYIRDFALNVPDFKQAYRPKSATLLKDDLLKSTDYLAKKFSDLLSSTQQLIKTMIDAKVVSTNHVTQITNVFLSLVMVFLSVLLLLVGVATIAAKPKFCESPRFFGVCQKLEKAFLEN
jgi:hypothetical protein